MNTFVTSPESREHLRHSRYNVSREMVEADHAEALGMSHANHVTADGNTRAIAAYQRARHEAGAINVRLDALAVTQAAELARFGINEADVESQGYEALHLMHAEARELNTYRTEAARHLSDAELDRAVSEYARDLAERPRCVACLSVDEHPVDCPFHPAVLEEARARLLDLTPADVTPEGLDVWAVTLRAGPKMPCPHCRMVILRKAYGAHLSGCASR